VQKERIKPRFTNHSLWRRLVSLGFFFVDKRFEISDHCLITDIVEVIKLAQVF
jgi:hypothetical protein